MFSDSFAGIAPSSAPAYITAQVAGGIAGVAVIKLLYPSLTSAQAADAIIPRDQETGGIQAEGLAMADGAGRLARPHGRAEQ